MSTKIIKEVTVYCKKPGEGHLMHQRPGSLVDGIFKPGEIFSIRPFESKKLPEDVADAMRRDFPGAILTDEEARAEQNRAEKALAEKDDQIADLQGQLDELKLLAAKAAKGNKVALAELATLLASAKVAEDAKPAAKVVPPGPAESAPQPQ